VKQLQPQKLLLNLRLLHLLRHQLLKLLLSPHQLRQLATNIVLNTKLKLLHTIAKNIALNTKAKKIKLASNIAKLQLPLQITIAPNIVQNTQALKTKPVLNIAHNMLMLKHMNAVPSIALTTKPLLLKAVTNHIAPITKVPPLTNVALLIVKNMAVQCQIAVVQNTNATNKLHRLA
jgi:hypothetical protein